MSEPLVEQRKYRRITFTREGGDIEIEVQMTTARGNHDGDPSYFYVDLDKLKAWIMEQSE